MMACSPGPDMFRAFRISFESGTAASTFAHSAIDSGPTFCSALDAMNVIGPPAPRSATSGALAGGS